MMRQPIEPPERNYEAHASPVRKQIERPNDCQEKSPPTNPAEVVPIIEARTHFSSWFCLATIVLGFLGIPHQIHATTPDRPSPVQPIRSQGVDERLTLPNFSAEVRTAQIQAPQQRTFRQFAPATPATSADDLGPEGPRQLTKATRQHIATARSVLEKIRQTQNYVSYLDGSTPVQLPVGLRRTLGGVEYVIGISAIRLLPTHAEFDAYVQIPIPQSAQPLTFMGEGLKFSRSGGIVGGAQLTLVSDFAVTPENKGIQVILKGDERNEGGRKLCADGLRRFSGHAAGCRTDF